MNVSDNNLRRTIDDAYRLAYFLLTDKLSSIQVVIEALSSLEVAGQKQVKRLKHPSNQRTKAVLSDRQILQRLTLIYADHFQRVQELSDRPHPPTREDWIVRWVQNLVVFGGTSLFHQTVGKCRVLHGYSTAESLKIYEFLTQGDDFDKEQQFRRAKALLIEKLLHRFVRCVQLEEGKRGEISFRSSAPNSKEIALAEQCQKRFSPWDIQPAAIPPTIDPLDDAVPDLKSASQDEEDLQLAGLRRLATLLTPDAFSPIPGLFQLPPSRQKLTIPEFIMNDDHTANPIPDRGDAPQLMPGEVDSIIKITSKRSYNRTRVFAPQELWIKVDRRQAAELNLEISKEISVPLPDLSYLLEIFVRQDALSTQVGTILLDRTDDGKIADCSYELLLAANNKVLLTIDSGELRLHYAAAPTMKSEVSTWYAKLLATYDVPLVRNPMFEVTCIQAAETEKAPSDLLSCPNCGQNLRPGEEGTAQREALPYYGCQSCGFIFADNDQGGPHHG